MRLCSRIRNEDGQTVILAALCFPVLLGFLGLAADVGILTIARDKAQSAADSAALAGAAELNYGDYTAAAQAAAALNGYTDAANGTTISVNPSGNSTPTPLYGAYAGQAGYLEVIVSQSQPTYFMRVFGFSSMTVSGRAVATQGRNPNCIYLLQTTGTTLTMNNAAKLTSSNCGLVDDSSGSSAVSVTDGSSLTTSSTEIAGSYTESDATVSPTPVTGIVPVSDPLAYLSPPSYTASSCTSDPGGSYQGGSTYSVGPGSNHSTTQNGNLVCYNSLTLGGNGNTVTVNPGIYVITGSLSLSSGTVKGGTGVTFYLVGSGSVSLAQGTTFNFTAPTSGTYNGILFYQNRADTQAATIEGGASSTMQGILYFPNAALTLGNGSAVTFYTPIIAATLTMYGGSNFTDDDYSTVNSASPLTSPRLVE
jgi:Flp pilus assembly protein TadG